MLFTQATKDGIVLENALILSSEQYKKAQIPANKQRIIGWAKDNHVEISIGDLQPASDFNCTFAIMMPSKVSDVTMNSNKKRLKQLGEELVEFIDNMPDKSEEAKKAAETHKKLDELIDKFAAEVKDLCGEDVAVHIEIVKIPIPEELISKITQMIESNETTNG